MKALFIFLALLFYMEVSAENKKELSNNSRIMAINQPLSSQQSDEASKTAKYLNLSANCRIGALTSVAVGGIWAGIISAKGDSFNTDDQKDKMMTIGLAASGVSALAFMVADVIFYKKAAKAAKIEIRPSQEGLGLNLTF